MPTNACASGWIDQGGPRELYVTGDPGSLRAACAEAAANATSSNPYIIRVAPCTITLTAPLTLPSFTTLIGASREATVIQRTVATTNTTYGGTFADPVIECTSRQSVGIQNLTLLHTGTTDATLSAGTANPVALMSGACKRLKLVNVRLEGSWAGWYDKTDSVDGSFSKPIPANKIGDEDFSYRVDGSIIVGHSVGGAHQLARHELFFTGCTFLVDISSTDIQSTSNMPSALLHWEFAVGHYKSCHFIARTKQTMTVSSLTEVFAAFAIRDNAIADTIAECDGCTFYIDLGDGDVNSASSGASSVYVNGNNTAGTLYPGNVFRANGCRFMYETGAITSAPFITGLYIESQSGVNAAVDAYLRNCTFEDIAGSGGTQRTDLVIGGRLGNVQPRKVELIGIDALDWAYRSITGTPIFTHSSFCKTPNNINFQQSSAAFSTAATAAVSLPLGYSASAGVTDYNVALEPSANETFWVSAKTNTGFTLNSSNATSTATIRYVVTR